MTSTKPGFQPMSTMSSLNVTSGEPGHHSEDGRNVIATERCSIIQAEDSRARKDIFYAAVQMSRMPMVLTDPHQPDNPIVFCNRAFEQLIGYPRDEIIGRNCRFLQGEATDRETVAEVRRALEAGEDVHEELINYRKDGSAFWNALFVSPVLDTDGSLVYHFASQLDVTRRREAEYVLQQSQRMETLGSLASSIAHEFNNLMTIVVASLERLENAQNAEKHGVYVKRALWGATRATRLTDQMLSFARRQFHDDQVVDINAMLVNFDGILQHVGGANVKVSLDLSREPVLAEVDQGQLELAILNLMRNATDAMEGSGAVVVSARVSADETIDGAPAVVVTVADTGSGMSEETILHATEPFYTTKAFGKGTGLGLSMVSGFAEQSGGRLQIESVLGVGTKMHLVFRRSTAGKADLALPRLASSGKA